MFNRSPNPLVTKSAMGGPERSITALVETVVPWTRRISSSGAIPSVSMISSRPVRTASAKVGGVDGTLKLVMLV